MQDPHYRTKRFIALSGITLLTSLTSGCYTPNCTYYRQPVTYVPQTPCYAATYSYPAYDSVLIPVEGPNYAWNTSCSPHRWRHDEEHEERPWHDRRSTYYGSQEIGLNPHRQEHREYAQRPTCDQKSIPIHSQSPVQSPPSAMPGYVTQHHPSFVNN